MAGPGGGACDDCDHGWDALHGLQTCIIYVISNGIMIYLLGFIMRSCFIVFSHAFLLTEFARTHVFYLMFLAGPQVEGAQQGAGPSGTQGDVGYAP